MKLTDIVYGAWMITPPMLEEIQGIYEAHTRREKLDLKAVEASLGRPLDNEQKPYSIENGTAVIPVHGVIGKRMNMFTRISGGASTQKIAEDFRAALQDPYVERVMLYIDSPGGAVDGTFELADEIYRSRGEKPVIAYTDGQMASAAYLIASAADERYISSDATAVGSIGVIAKHQDISAQQERSGVKTTVLTAGKYKGTGHQYGPLSEQDRGVMQDELDYLYGAFVDTVARNLGVSSATVLNEMADGRVFIGTQAVAAGLVDGVSTYAEALAGSGKESAISGGIYHMAHTVEPHSKGEATMTLAELQEQHPETYAEALAEGKTMGAEAERERIKAIHELPAGGNEDLIQAALWDGASTAGDVAMAVLKKEASVRAGVLADLLTDAPKPAAASEAGEVPGGSDEQTQAVASMVEFARQSGRA